MKTEKIFLVIGIILVVGIAATMWSRSGRDTTQDNTSPAPVDQGGVVQPKKAIKRFTLAGQGAAIAGDGSMTPKENLVSIAVRMTEAPALNSGEQYALFARQDTAATPVEIGAFFPGSGQDKYIWAGAGKTDLFAAAEFIISRRSAGDSGIGNIEATISLSDASVELLDK